MCVRITQYDVGRVYAEALGWHDLPAERCLDPEGPRYNVAPGASPRVMHRLGPDYACDMARLHWGYTPASNSQYPAKTHTNARVETAWGSQLFGELWQHGRCLVPVEGWYEWQGQPDNEIPFRIHHQLPPRRTAATRYRFCAHQCASRQWPAGCPRSPAGSAGGRRRAHLAGSADLTGTRPATGIRTAFAATRIRMVCGQRYHPQCTDRPSGIVERTDMTQTGPAAQPAPRSINLNGAHGGDTTLGEHAFDRVTFFW
jgi:hypothetical protein